MASTIFQRLTATKLALDEIEEVIASHFGHSSWTDDGHVEFSHLGLFVPDVALTLLLGEDRRPRDAIAGPGLKDSDIEAIETALTKLASTSTYVHYRQVAFTNAPVRSAYKYKDYFQIVPVPIGSPVPAQAMAEWPFVFEFTYMGSANMSIDAHRRAKAESKLLSLLNVLFISGVFVRPSHEKVWVMGPRGETQYLQAGYYHPVPSGPRFLERALYPPMRRSPAQTYYGGFAETLSGFSLPDDIETSLDCYHAMSEADRDRFDIAAHWFSRYADLKKVSMSSGIVALVTALEALSPKSRVPPCPTCGNISAAVRGFQTLLDAVLQSNTEAKDQFYRLRSKIAHGAWLLHSDFSAWGGGSQARLEEFDVYRLEETVRQVLYRWLQPEIRDQVERAAARSHRHG
ncbi:hypothetical protein SAMN05216456_1452 [Devosia crocina]|uniref:Apea-like HEPN domain-containing protein n=1 Tax=Devosia crocina TaxID=429728 RepID=A0A1I7NAS5_9HYPH|nr:hypothetical protein [Devosia crocina]SFV31770.1 hypothetical protein SAMN05216456_1452 [Devosia crocina]